MHPFKNRIASDFFLVQNLSSSYRYSFQNQENDKEIKGSGNSIDFGARIYDSRVGRWLSCDPLFGNQPSWSPYKAMYDNPMIYQDPDGMDEIIRIRVVDYKSNTTTVIETTIPYLVMTDGRYRQEGALPAYYGYYNYVSNYTLYLHKEGPPTGTSDGVQILTNELQMQDLILGPFQIEPKYGDQSLVIPEFSFEGSGGYQPSGFRLVSKEGGASPTKQKSGHVAQEMEVSGLLALMGISGPGGPSNIYEKVQEFVHGAYQIDEAVDEYQRSSENEGGGGSEEYVSPYQKEGYNRENIEHRDGSKIWKEFYWVKEGGDINVEEDRIYINTVIIHE